MLLCVVVLKYIFLVVVAVSLCACQQAEYEYMMFAVGYNGEMNSESLFKNFIYSINGIK